MSVSRLPAESASAPTDGSVTDIKVATGAAINADKLADGTTNKVLTATERTKLTGVATGATANSADATLLSRANHTGTQSADTLTDGTTNKAFLATERTKLTGVATAATANSPDATLLNRTNHTGTQAASTIGSGTVDTARLGSGTASSATFLRGDQTWATTSGGSSVALVHAVGNSGTALTLDAASASGWIKTITLTGNCTLTLTGATSGQLAEMLLYLTQDGTGSRLVTFSPVPKSSGGLPVLSTAPGSIDVLRLSSVTGNTGWMVDVVGKAYA